MKRLKRFNEFINEDEFKIDNPKTAASDLADVIGQNLNIKEIGVNAGSDVNRVQKSVGIPTGQPWCMAFVYYIFDEFSKKMGVPNPVYKTGSALTEWEKTTGKKITIDDARSNFSLVKPGQIFVATRSGGGHVGIITSVDYNGKKFTTVEGNTHLSSGDGVSASNRSLNMQNLVGFIDYFPNRDPEFDMEFSNAIKDKVNDVSKLSVDRGLPSGKTIGIDGSTSNPSDGEDKKSGPGGIFGAIVKGARKFYDPEDSGGDVDAQAAAKAFSGAQAAAKAF